jgi:hypothetical protein
MVEIDAVEGAIPSRPAPLLPSLPTQLWRGGVDTAGQFAYD